MLIFKQSLDPRLYLSETNEDHKILVAYIVPVSTESLPVTISLQEAFTHPDYQGSFVFSARTANIETKENAGKFVIAFTKAMETIIGNRKMVWLKDPDHINNGTLVTLGFDNTGRVNVGMLVNLVDGLQLDISTNCKLALSKENTGFWITTDTNSYIKFVGSSSPTTSSITKTEIPLTTAHAGCLLFDLSIERFSLYENLRWGFQFLFADSQSQKIACWYPLADKNNPNPSDMICFTASIDPTDITNEYLEDRSYFAFTGKNQDGIETHLDSYYRSSFGHKVTLFPVALSARFVFTIGISGGDKGTEFLLSPEGDFSMSVDNHPLSKDYDLLCALSGTEVLRCNPDSPAYQGDYIRFKAGQPAYAPVYPCQPASTVAAPYKPHGQRINNEYKTSWASVNVMTKDHYIQYIAQPQGAALFGQDQFIHQQFTDFLGHMAPGISLPQDVDTFFPLPPYAGVSISDKRGKPSAQQIEDFERQVLAPVRFSIVSQAATQLTSSSISDSYQVTTSSGMLVNINKHGQWQKILLAQNLQPKQQQFGFLNPDTKLQQALQSNQLFLVAANAKHLGVKADKAVGDEAVFLNTINIEDWVLSADVGQQNRYADYRNVLIIKNCKGKLYDPSVADKTENLVANLCKWILKEEFSAPTDLQSDPQDPSKKIVGDPNPAEIVVLSQWLQDFFHDAVLQKEGQYFKKLNAIAQDENWTGILILKMNIQLLPHSLAGITSGINDPNAFNVHHFGIETSYINNDLQGLDMQDTSSMFGLINYVDSSYNPSDENATVASSGIYDFKLLMLQVLFANSSIKEFYSRAQITLHQLFGSRVIGMGNGGNINHSILLRGSFQKNGDIPIYGLSTFKDYSFIFDNNVLNKIEITSAQMSTQLATDQETNIQFKMTGYLDFNKLQKGYENDVMDIDLFSFGSIDGKTVKSGLCFSALSLDMTFPTKTPDQHTFTLNTNQISFDPSVSTIRQDSLYHSFALEVIGLVSGSGDDNKPSNKGFLTVLTDLHLSGVDKELWYGLKFRLNMGTPGELAGKVGLNADLLLAWAAEGGKENNYKVEVGLYLPGVTSGANLISLQNVLKLSFGPIRLLYVKDPNNKEKNDTTIKRRFMLLLTNIVLRFMGLIKIPPNGNTIFYLFGNPESGATSGLGWYAMYRKKKKFNKMHHLSKDGKQNTISERGI